MKQEMMWQCHQHDHMQIICTSLQIYIHSNTLSLNFHRPEALPDTEPTASKHWRPLLLLSKTGRIICTILACKKFTPLAEAEYQCSMLQKYDYKACLQSCLENHWVSLKRRVHSVHATEHIDQITTVLSILNYNNNNSHNARINDNHVWVKFKHYP